MSEDCSSGGFGYRKYFGETHHLEFSLSGNGLCINEILDLGAVNSGYPKWVSGCVSGSCWTGLPWATRHSGSGEG